METFVVRIWRPGEDEAGEGSSPALRGVVQHARSAQPRLFRDEQQLLGVLRADLDSLAAERDANEAVRDERNRT